MLIIERFRALDTIVKGYLVGHGLAFGAFIGLAALSEEGLAPDIMSLPFWVGVALFGLSWLAQLFAMLGGVGPFRVMRHALPAELLAIPLLVLGTHDHRGISFAVAISVPVFYIAVQRSRRMWIVGALCAVVFLAGHGLAVALGAVHSFGDWLGIVMQATAIVYLSVALAAGVTRQAERESELREANERNVDLAAQLQKRLTELQAVSEITEIIHSTLDFDTVGPVVIDILQKVMNLPSCSLFVIDRAKGETLFAASKAGSEAPVLPNRTSGYDLLRGGAIDGHFSCTSVFDHNSMMVVFCAETERMQEMTSEDHLVLQAVASELVVAVENSQLYKLTRRLAITDELTALYNYRYLQQRLDEEIERARRYDKSVSLIMFDADDFKGFNDSNGHMAGDRALATLADVVKRCVREVDIVARYGGEEFSVILPETDATGAYVAAEKIREAVAGHEFADADGESGARITISIGVATFPSHAQDKETLLKAADDALYRAKASGKDRVRSPQTRVEPAGERVGDRDAAEEGASA